MNEEQVFKQELDDEELEDVAGGRCKTSSYQSRVYGCIEKHWRKIYEDGFPNCARSVEDGSSCDYSDACYGNIVKYEGMGILCPKAHE